MNVFITFVIVLTFINSAMIVWTLLDRARADRVRAEETSKLDGRLDRQAEELVKLQQHIDELDREGRN